jgi:hypothetical protein
MNKRNDVGRPKRACQRQQGHDSVVRTAPGVRIVVA